MPTTDRIRTDSGPSWDWLSAALVFSLVQVAAARLVMTAWTPYLYFTETLGAFGVMLGLGLGQSRFSRRVVRGLAIAYTAVLISWQLTQAVEAEAAFAEKLASIGGRFWFSLGQFLAWRPVEDVILFVAFTGFAFWFIGLSAGYSLTRHRDYLTAVLPGGIAMLIIQAYDYFVPVRIWALGIYIFLALLLLGRMYFNQTRTQWDRNRVFVTFEARRDLMNSLIAIAAFSVLAAWSLPASLSNIQSAAQTWNRFTRPLRERLSNAVSALESPYGGGNSRGNFYGETLALSRNASLGDTPVLTIFADDTDKDVPPRYYWRGHVYNYYANGKWSNTLARESDFAPNADVLLLPETGFEREQVRFTVTLRLPQQGLLYAPAEPFWINRPGSLLAALTPDQGQDLAAWLADPGLSAGDRYEVRALIANPTVEELRAAGMEYPEWVSARYLQVPENILSEVKTLAEEITQDEETPYDMAQAITFYLRQQIQYATSIPAPPEGRDPVLWVLQDSKRGFCLYYASAEIMLLRSLGVPARMAVGFAQGEVDEDDVYIVRKVDAHAWPEVYFPGIGWVEFEPTGNQDPLRRPLTSSASQAPNNPAPVLPGLELDEGSDALREGRVDESGVQEAVPFNETPLARGLWIGSWILLVVALSLLNVRYQWMRNIPIYLSEPYRRAGAPPPVWLDRWARWNHLTSIERSFHAVNLSLYWLGRPQPMHVTPIGRAQALQRLLPSANASVDTLLSEHQSTLFSPRPGNAALARRAAFDILIKTFQARVRGLLERITGTPIDPDGNL